MARASSRDNRDLGLRRIRTTENDFVFRVIGKRRVCESQGVQSGLDQMGRVREEVLG